ncbi:HlyD family efflux transporter periplasmic adaptor subunit [Brucella tritici]|uniref:HlyD family efflux transporter periplasmic adaptor subunit n=1 Tax=Brucella tritici TaxID=94626 RepID=UPI0020014356|nr:HlyD family efflux transporter periplasmic adaptor subunit [Brucella tritici]
MTGKIVNTSGIISVFSPMNGTITESKIADKVSVTKGDPLFVISADKSTIEGPLAARIIKEKENEINEINEIKKLAQLRELVAKNDVDNLSINIVEKKNELFQVTLQISKLNSYLLWLTEVIEQQRSLIKNGIGLESAHYERQREYHTKLIELSSIKRGQEQLLSEINQLNRSIEAIPVKLKADLTAFDRDATRVRQEIIQATENTNIIIRATVTGRVAPPIAVSGSAININDPLITIIPEDGKFAVDLTASTEAVGLLSIGSNVLLRYDAFPYKRFGQYLATIEGISEAPKPTRRETETGSETPLYLVRLGLESKGIAFGDRNLEFRPGMAVSAYALIETRPLYQWLMLPLFERLRESRQITSRVY